MSSSRPRQCFREIIDNIERVRSYTAGLDASSFAKDGKTVDAVERCLGRISEAAVKLGREAEERVPRQPWNDVRGLGNHLRHGYDAIDPKRLWITVTEELNSLYTDCHRVLERWDGEPTAGGTDASADAGGGRSPDR